MIWKSPINLIVVLLLSSLLLALHQPQKAYGQEMLGLTLGNYSGSAGLMVNPAMITNNKTFLDINLVSADLFFHNNFAFLPSSDFVVWDLFKSDYIFPTYGDYDKNFLYYQDKSLKDATFNLRILGPSAVLQVGKHGFGLQTGVRFFTSGNRIPWEIPVFGYEGLFYDQLHDIRFQDYDFNFTSTAWMEVGLSYAYDVYHFLDHKVTVGVSLKKLWGYSGASVKTQNVDYVVFNDSTISVVNMNAEVGFALPMDYNENSFSPVDPVFKGSGLGLDLGVVYVKKKSVDRQTWRGGQLCAQTYDDYLYRIGVSVLDIGRINYKSNAQLHTFNNVSVFWDQADTLQYTTMNQLMGDISTILYGNPDASLTGTSVKIGLPTALSVQFDYHYVKQFYVGAYWIHPLPLYSNSLRRAPMLAVIPRYETHYLEVSLPVSLYEYQYPRIGLSARFYFFTIGTERLGTYLGMADMNGLDIYASIKLGIGKGSCKNLFGGGACSNANFGNKNKF